ncbi:MULTISPECIES: ArsR/SmtB family transcription factor [Idiomarina]|uniref:ArsR/SmtB family transcription factor n=1 Tax=Idiomarinaceae TaxID=267893 RepID=UPI00129AC7D4|nr:MULTISPECIES: metalloregulator ArsR/SmtB family transcription factor [Idiomarina]MRJ41757.1 metalloregulator ArsR/SmtB family transcription factor [Idiomarina sp. FeN1]NCU57747.1 metalloregulator ArsR/SmtB family transcription factor [Idiomarina sp. FenA--70]NCU60299.1 metalloregulator ArsR/SmtB family transcription factor [Idiomarina sp. FenBw--71]UUN13857.1 helix-turn-helix transcriptional regulator [Idiomarina loihiensis]
MTDTQITELQQDEANMAAGFLRSLANEHRLQILCHLANGERSVGDLNRHFPLSASAFSQHLAVLREQGLVKFRKEAQTIYYSIQDPDTLAFIQLLKTKFCPDLS